jgi:hypothetical protein
MKIKNSTPGNILIGDLPNAQGSYGVSLPSTQEMLIFNEDAERSNQLGTFLANGAILNLGSEEPSTGTLQAASQPAVVGAYQVTVTNVPVAGKALVSTGANTAEWQSTGGTITLIDGEVPSGLINGINKIFTLAQLPASGSLHLYKNGLRQRPTIDYTIVGQTITFVIEPNVSSNLLADYRL